MEKKLKHLDFLQLIITRMNVNSFLLKGWTVTLASAIFVFAAKESNIKYVSVTYVSTLLFWFLDGYYLSLERQYRKLYDAVRIIDDEKIDFALNAKPYNTGENTWLRCTFSTTLIIFYGALMVITSIFKYVFN